MAIIYLKASGIELEAEVISSRCRWEGRDIDSYRGIGRAKKREAGKENEKRDKIELLRGDESARGETRGGCAKTSGKMRQHREGMKDRASAAGLSLSFSPESISRRMNRTSCR